MAAVPVTTAQLREAFDVDDTALHRWRSAGWVTAEFRRQDLGPLRWPSEEGSGRRLVWPPWAVRMVGLLALLRTPGGGGSVEARARNEALVSAISLALERWPTAPWFVVDPRTGRVLPAWNAAHVAALTRAAAALTGGAAVIVSPPLDGLDFHLGAPMAD